MTKKHFIFYYLLFLSCGVVFGQNITKSDSIVYDTLGPGLKLIWSLEKDGEDVYYWTSYRDSKGRRHTRARYLDGKKRDIGNCNIFHTLRHKTWDKDGRVISKSRQFPFTSTSYTYVRRQKTYNSKGKLIKYESEKSHSSCWEGRGLYRYKLVLYDDNGKFISKKKISRFKTWREWKRTGHSVRLKDD